MHNEKRIDCILAKLKEMWECEPDWRLGQLLCNILNADDIFYVEDDIFEAALDSWLERK